MLSKNYLISRFYQQIKFLITFITIGTMFAHSPRKVFKCQFGVYAAILYIE